MALSAVPRGPSGVSTGFVEEQLGRAREPRKEQASKHRCIGGASGGDEMGEQRHSSGGLAEHSTGEPSPTLLFEAPRNAPSSSGALLPRERPARGDRLSARDSAAE